MLKLGSRQFAFLPSPPSPKYLDNTTKTYIPRPFVSLRTVSSRYNVKTSILNVNSKVLKINPSGVIRSSLSLPTIHYTSYNAIKYEFKRTYATITKKKLIKSTKKIKPKKDDTELPLPDGLVEQVGPISKDMIEQMIKEEKRQKAELLEAQHEEERKKLEAEEEAEEYEEYEDEREIYDEETIKKGLEMRKRKRKPPPFRPGRVILNPDNWTFQTKDCLVEFLTNEEGAYTTHLGLLRRPKGQRNWGVVNIETKSEQKVNIYKITFQWPADPTTGLSAKSIDEAKILKVESDILLSNIKVLPSAVWKHFLFLDRLETQRKTEATSKNQTNSITNDGTSNNGDNNASQTTKKPTKPLSAAAQRVHFLNAKQGVSDISTAKNKNSNVIDEDYEEEKPDSMSFLDLEKVAVVLFPNTENIQSVHLYAAHRFLTKHENYFESNIHRGFFCRAPHLVLSKLQQHKMMEEDAQIRRDFVDKLRTVLAATDTQSVSEMQFNARDQRFLEQMKRFALAGDVELIDADVIANILTPLGFGDKPHHAFDLIVQLGLISKFDNPHLLRWDGPLHFTETQQKLAHEIIHFIDFVGSEERSIPDIDASRRVDFSQYPTFALDSSNPHEVDDAISLVTDEQNRDWVYVHVTDVNRYILPNSGLDLAARDRASSVYLPDVSFGMFPDLLKDHLSLGGKPQTHVAETTSTNENTKKGSVNIQAASAARLNSLFSDSNPSKSSSVTASVLSQRQGQQQQDRGKQPVLSFGALIDGGGKIEQWKVVNGYVDNVQQLSFSQLDEILAPNADDVQSSPKQLGSEEKEETIEARFGVSLTPVSHTAALYKKKYYNIFLRLLDLATKRRSYRLDNRAIIASIPSPDVRMVVDSTGRAVAHVGVHGDIWKNTRGMVAEFMLMAGQVAGHFARANNVPVFYQSQDVKKDDRERSLVDIGYQAQIIAANPSAKGPEILKNLELMRMLRPRVTTTIPSNNDAYGLPYYVTVTSPLRKYMDLVSHYQIKAALRRESGPFNLKELHELGTAIQATATEVKALNTHGTRFWILGCIAELLKEEQYRKFQAVVLQSRTDQSKDEARIMMLDFALENNMTTKRHLHKGEVIWVRVEIVNPFYDTMILKETRKAR